MLGQEIGNIETQKGMVWNFEAIYEEQKDLVFNLALNYVQSREDAEEITQDVFVSVYHSLEKFRADAKVSTWIYRIAINKSLDFIKKKTRKKRLGFLFPLFYEDGSEIKDIQENFDHPGVQMENKEQVAIIFKHINGLPANQKTAIILSKIEEKSQSEIAEIMDLSVKAVDSLVQRAKKNLAKRLSV